MEKTVGTAKICGESVAGIEDIFFSFKVHVVEYMEQIENKEHIVSDTCNRISACDRLVM